MLENMLKKCYDEEFPTADDSESVKTAVLSRIEKENHMKRFKIKPLIIAAAVVVVASVAVGFTTVWRDEVRTDDGTILDYNYTIQEGMRVVPENELVQMGAVYGEHNERECYTINALPSEVFGWFNVNPLMNDKFTESKSDITIYYNNCNEDGSKGNTASVSFRYSLVNITTGLEIRLQADARFSEEAGISTNFHGKDDTREVFTFNDGSKALVYHLNSEENGIEYYGTFSYGGIVYDFRVIGANDNSIKQIFADFGIM